MHDRKSAASFRIRQLRMDGVLVRALADMPESGMGYQLVNVHLNDGTIIYEISAIACQMLEISDEQRDFLESEVVAIEVLDRNGVVTHRKTLSSRC
ncbi:hypothetical protein A2673_00845 [Candidatus Kaiserbacteria bacterium RIFCSPHIGHO2_01_FULL_50_13]|uniref:Uncharacterized protein n=1 Tax=Candidatus Kaiserbacteria bacterium RIFCSPLOWO2_01_FULL_50_24 TaxID=1798507 RepID=A0A1F6EMV2_9BACT|nr:MAG: hypothetical protein A2673_00845 [Candidatus Kaiserbacteria bacterium RIFCSPHIGHO2_01_FULL_50_13]OGG74974.1 MAG: hypothetical protein A3A34_04120 [Candidatus Kaiserbacteria bacterium RIFCSPLOWO2_01_FULL_50_24]OGG81776.1 MAG: hypothetical protein A3H74_01195 [Candidatus Kaiserbacteria bacterium RIFCSPLOWO2_02_FULL_51_13]